MRIGFGLLFLVVIGIIVNGGRMILGQLPFF